MQRLVQRFVLLVELLVELLAQLALVVALVAEVVLAAERVAGVVVQVDFGVVYFLVCADQNFQKGCRHQVL